MLTTIVMTLVVMKNTAVSSFLYSNFKAVSLGSGVVSSVIALALVSVPKLRYTTPFNFILLGIFTILQSLMIGTISSLLDPRILGLGTMHTLSVFLGVALYSLQTKYDITAWSTGLLGSSIALVVGSLLAIVFKMPLFDNLFAAGFAVLFAVYLAYDMQMIVGGKSKKHQYSPKEYILAALNMYMDAMNLFLQIIQLLNDLDSKSTKSKRQRH